MHFTGLVKGTGNELFSSKFKIRTFISHLDRGPAELAPKYVFLFYARIGSKKFR